MSQVVAISRAIKGGVCPECGMPIGVGNKIYKYAGPGGTTQFGNGPGYWVCAWCHQKRGRLEGGGYFVCSRCGQHVDAVVEAGGALWCPTCWGAHG